MDIFGSGSSEEDFFQGVGCGAELLEGGSHLLVSNSFVHWLYSFFRVFVACW